MNRATENRHQGNDDSGRHIGSVPDDLADMDRSALISLVESLFRWALRHTGLTRYQIWEQIKRDEAAPHE